MASLYTLFARRLYITAGLLGRSRRQQTRPSFLLLLLELSSRVLNTTLTVELQASKQLRPGTFTGYLLQIVSAAGWSTWLASTKTYESW